MGGVGRVEIDNVFDTTFRNEAEIVDCEIAVGVDDTITLIIKDVGKGEELEEAGFSGASLTDDVDVAGAVAAEQAELVVDSAEISETESRNVFVVGRVSGYHRKFSGRFGGFRIGPDDVRGFYACVREVIDGGELANVEDEAIVGELAEFVSIEGFRFERSTEHLKAV